MKKKKECSCLPHPDDPDYKYTMVKDCPRHAREVDPRYPKTLCKKHRLGKVNLYPGFWNCDECSREYREAIDELKRCIEKGLIVPVLMFINRCLKWLIEKVRKGDR